MSIRDLISKHRFIILYGFFGICTTIVNVIAYGVMERLFGFSILWSTIVAWLLAVIFAYVTNRKWVFCSNSTGNAVFKELYAFFACRIGTGVIDCVIMQVFADWIGLNDIVVKFVANVVVIVLNYVGSKLFVFKSNYVAKK